MRTPHIGLFRNHRHDFVSFPTLPPLTIFAVEILDRKAMPVIINTQFDQFYLSAELPERVSFAIQDADESAEVSVYVDQDEVFSTTLYASGHNLYLLDIRSIIEDAIRANYNCTGECSVGIKDAYTQEYSDPFTVVLSDFSVTNPVHFLTHYFLTTRSSFRIHREGRQALSWVAVYTETIDKYIEAVLLPDGSDTPIVQRWDEGSQKNYGGMAYTFNVYPDSVATHFENIGKLLAFTVHRGTRSMTFYVTDEIPDFHILFLNAFNVQEYAEIYGTTTIKHKVERSEAHCQRDRIFYDQSTETTNEVQTAALPYEEALWLNQLFASRYATILRNYKYRPILITESTSEISDSDNDLIRLKFTWKFAKDITYHYAAYNEQVFTEEFQLQFQ